MELRGQRDVCDGIALVRRHQHRLAPAPQQVGDLVLTGARPGPRVDHQHSNVGVGESRPRLVANRARQRILVGEVHAAGIDQREGPAVPLTLELLAVSGDPGALVHDRLARACQTVDQRGLADVRVADDRDLHRRFEVRHRSTTRGR